MLIGEKKPTRDMVGRERAFVRFAWRPVRLSCGRLCWWERYVEVQRVAGTPLPSPRPAREDYATDERHEYALSWHSLTAVSWIYYNPPHWTRDRLVPFREFIP
jgi:hypothetical protein